MKPRRNGRGYFYAGFDDEWAAVEEPDRVRSLGNYPKREKRKPLVFLPFVMGAPSSGYRAGGRRVEEVRVTFLLLSFSQTPSA